METNKNKEVLSKVELRKRILKKRDELFSKEHNDFSKIIADRIIEWDKYAECESLLVYVSFRSEVNTYGIINNALEKGKKVYCPRVNGEDMLFFQIKSLDDLTSGYMGIMEPREGVPEFDYADEKCLMIMPGSVFDKNGNRVGYGKGYYDRFLSHCQKKGINLITSALAFSFQVVENIPAEEHDYKTDYIFTEKEIFEF